MKPRNDLQNFVGAALLTIAGVEAVVAATWLPMHWWLAGWSVLASAILGALGVLAWWVGMNTLWAFWVWHRDYASDKER